MLGNPPTRHGATRTKQAPLRWADIPPKPLKFWMKWWCPGAELNHRHTDFQSVALPTELPGLIKDLGDFLVSRLHRFCTNRTPAKLAARAPECNPEPGLAPLLLPQQNAGSARAA